MTETELVHRARSGDEAAFRELYESARPCVFPPIVAWTKNMEDAEDLLQDTFLQAFKNLHRFRGDSTFRTWLYRIARNQFLMNIRRRKPQPLSLDNSEDPSIVDFHNCVGYRDHTAEGLPERALIAASIAQLAKGQREVFLLKAVHGFKHEEIVEKLGIKLGTSKSQYSKAQLKMRQIISGQRTRDRMRRDVDNPKKPTYASGVGCQ